MIRINVLISRKLYGFSINIVEYLFSENKKHKRMLVRFLRVVVFFIFSKEIPKIYIKRRADYSTERRQVVRGRMTILNRKLNISFFVLCLLEI